MGFIAELGDGSGEGGDFYYKRPTRVELGLDRRGGGEDDNDDDDDEEEGKVKAIMNVGQRVKFLFGNPGARP